MVATVLGIGMEEPPMVMMAGLGDDVEPPLMEAEKVWVLLPTVTLMEIEFPLILAVREVGAPGKSPSSYCSKALRISSWRQVYSALVVTFLPSENVNGSGRYAFETVGILVAGVHAWRSKSGVTGDVGRARAAVLNSTTASSVEAMAYSVKRSDLVFLTVDSIEPEMSAL
jgi:hypothetical protein